MSTPPLFPENRLHVHGLRCWWNHLEARWSCAIRLR
jgi:hypothetical protein